MGTEDSSRIGHRPFVPQASGEDSAHHSESGSLHRFSQPVQETIEQNHDRYGAHLINRVMRGLSSLMLNRSDRGAEIRNMQSQHGTQQGAQQGGRHQGPRTPESMRPMVMRDGRMMPATEGEVRSGAAHHASQASHGRPHATAAKTDLSGFEKVFLAHFESGAPLGEKLPAGVQKFLKKTAQEWKSFFANLSPFTAKKSVKAGDVQAVIFRGLAEEINENGPHRMLLVSDLKLVPPAGRLQAVLEKFARIALPQQQEMLLQLMERLAQNQPGDVLPESLVQELISQLNNGSELTFTALSHRLENPQMVNDENKFMTKEVNVQETNRQATPGMALDARTERLMAERLDIALTNEKGNAKIDEIRASSESKISSQHTQTPVSLLGKQKKRSFWKDLTGEDGVGNPSPYFFPWLQKSGQRLNPGKPKWYIAFMYSVAAVAALIVIYYFLRHSL